MKRSISFRPTLLALVLATNFPVAHAAVPKDMLVIGKAADPQTLDPAVTIDNNDWTVTYPSYQRLVQYKTDGDKGSTDVEGDLASSWKASDDQKEWTFTLKDNAKFADGTPVTAEAVKLSFERLLKIGQGPAEAFPKDLKIDAPDEHTVKFTLSQPFAPFLYTLANDGASIINPAVLKEHAADDARGFLAQNTAGSGPFMLKSWQKQCQEKKAQAKGWRLWLEEEMGWQLPEGDFWQDKKVQRRMASRLDRWISLMRMHGGSQAEMIAGAPETVRDLFSKRVKLMSPLLKEWKAALKAENAVDFSGLIHQAVNILDKGRFVSPWKHILVDEFQDISPQRASLLAALRRQNSQTTLFAVGDDWQAIYRFSGAQLSLTTAFNHYFGEGDCCALDTTYRFNGRIGEIANGFIQQNPHQLSKPLNSLTAGDKKAVTLLADDKLDDLLDKLSGYVKPEQRILLLARYHHLKPEALDKAATRWPHLQLDFMTIHASKGQQADYVIVLGLQEGVDAFPAPARESIIEEALLPQPEDFPDAEERRLLYVAITRARHRVWLLFNKAQPSPFVEILQALDVPVARKP
jgi:superfamily I DNA/RNA helicase